MPSHFYTAKFQPIAQGDSTRRSRDSLVLLVPQSRIERLPNALQAFVQTIYTTRASLLNLHSLFRNRKIFVQQLNTDEIAIGRLTSNTRTPTTHATIEHGFTLVGVGEDEVFE